LPDGLVITKQEDLEQHAVSLYQDLFTAQQNLHPDGVLQYVQAKVTDEMNCDTTASSNVLSRVLIFH
jgi:hypothetical protein